MFAKPAIENGSGFIGLRDEDTSTRSVITDRPVADGGEVYLSIETVTAAGVSIAQSRAVECGDLIRSRIEDRHIY